MRSHVKHIVHNEIYIIITVGRVRLGFLFYKCVPRWFSMVKTGMRPSGNKINNKKNAHVFTYPHCRTSTQSVIVDNTDHGVPRAVVYFYRTIYYTFVDIF